MLHDRPLDYSSNFAPKIHSSNFDGRHLGCWWVEASVTTFLCVERLFFISPLRVKEVFFVFRVVVPDVCSWREWYFAVSDCNEILQAGVTNYLVLCCQKLRAMDGHSTIFLRVTARQQTFNFSRCVLNNFCPRCRISTRDEPIDTIQWRAQRHGRNG